MLATNGLERMLTIQKLNSRAAMMVLKEFLPKADLSMLDDNFQLNNLPRIGSDDNTAFPGGQINLAEAVAHTTSRCQCNFDERHRI
jgi:Leu/Phe-tRNA-protein transferase